MEVDKSGHSRPGHAFLDLRQIAQSPGYSARQPPFLHDRHRAVVLVRWCRREEDHRALEALSVPLLPAGMRRQNSRRQGRVVSERRGVIRPCAAMWPAPRVPRPVPRCAQAPVPCSWPSPRHAREQDAHRDERRRSCSIGSSPLPARVLGRASPHRRPIASPSRPARDPRAGERTGQRAGRARQPQSPPRRGPRRRARRRRGHALPSRRAAPGRRANSTIGRERRNEKRRGEQEREFRSAECWKGTEATAEEPQLLHDPGSPGERIRAPLQGRIARRYFPFFLSKAGPFLAASS